jgi:hypothetical protein
MKHTRIPRIVLALVVCLSALFMTAATGYSVPKANAYLAPTPTATPTCPPDYEWTSWGGCRPIPKPCPSGTIDVNGNGNNDGGNDCQALDTIITPSICGAWPPPGLLGPEGGVACALPWSLNGQSVVLLGATGCLDITRTPYPRAMVGVPTTFEIRGLFDGVATIPDDLPGGYRLSSVPWATEGLYLHERYTAISYDYLGRPAFNTRSLLGSDPYPYPSLNNVRAYLLFQMATDPNRILWTTESFSGAPLTGGLPGNRVTLESGYPRSSFPLSRYWYQISNYGPDKYGQNVLTAFKVRVETAWQLYLVAEWDAYYVDGNNAYTRGAHQGVVAPIGSPYESYRAWDGRQSLSFGAQSVYCNAQDGYLPVPVLEAQSVLKR